MSETIIIHHFKKHKFPENENFLALDSVIQTHASIDQSEHT